MVSVDVVGRYCVFGGVYMMRNIVIIGLYIALKLIEDQRLVECCCDLYIVDL